MVDRRFRKVIDPNTRAARPAGERISPPPSSPNAIPSIPSIVIEEVEDAPQSIDVKELHLDQKKLKAEIYKSLRHTTAANDESSVEPVPVTTTNEIAKPVDDQKLSHSHPFDSPVRYVTFEDQSHVSERLSYAPMDTQLISMDGESLDKTSRSISHRSIIHQKSSSIFNVVKTALRNNRGRPQHDQAIVVSDQEDCSDRDEILSTIASRGSFESSAESPPEKAPKPRLRDASGNTISSESSKDSGNTVRHWASRHASFPFPYQDPNKNRSAHDQMPLNRHDSNDSTPATPDSGIQVFESSGYVPPAVSSLPEYTIPQRLFSDTGLQLRQLKAFVAFNSIAETNGFYRLVRPDCDPINFQQFIRPKPSKREILLHQIRSIRSFLRPRSPIANVPTLRRVRTIAALSNKYYTRNILKGKTLETLGQSAGYGNLTLPGDFAPAVMKLPGPVATMISYLRLHGPKSRNLFVDPGDITVASRIYDHFANQVLSAEEKDATDITVRRADFSSDILGVDSNQEASIRGRFYVLPVAWAFKRVLAGIPGGFLGAPRLFHTLLDISYCRFLDDPAFPQLGPNGALPNISSFRSRAIASAILALTSDMQLDLLCAVFGLCSLLDFESQVMLHFCRTKNVPPLSRAGLLTRKQILLTFTPLLCEETKGLTEDDLGCDAFVVMEMMLDYWRVISRLLHFSDL